MKRMKNAEADTPQPLPARRRGTGRSKASHSTLQMNREGEWMESGELRTSLLSLLSTQGETVLDLAGLTHVDAGCFQVLVSAAQSSLFSSGRARLVNASEPVCHCFHLAGAEALLPVQKEGC